MAIKAIIYIFWAFLVLSRRRTKPIPDATNCNINRVWESSSPNERQIVVKCVWFLDCGSAHVNVPMGRETLFAVMCVILAQSYLRVDFIMWSVLFALGFVGFTGFVKEWVRKAERRDETTHTSLVKHQPPMAASQIPRLRRILAALSSTLRGIAPIWGPMLHKWYRTFTRVPDGFQKKHCEFLSSLFSCFSPSSLTSHFIFSIPLTPPLGLRLGLDGVPGGLCKSRVVQGGKWKARKMRAREEKYEHRRMCVWRIGVYPPRPFYSLRPSFPPLKACMITTLGVSGRSWSLLLFMSLALSLHF